MSSTRPWRRAVATAGTALLMLSIIASRPLAAGIPAPGKGDKCPVCGMFVARYPDWTASVRFKDGSRSHFDGVKDMMKFLLAPEKYGSRSGAGAIADIRVKDYYSLEMIDGRSAWYVLGSDVLGPMGKELIPFAGKDDAAAFLKDHRGKRTLRFSELNTAVLKELE